MGFKAIEKPSEKKSFFLGFFDGGHILARCFFPPYGGCHLGFFSRLSPALGPVDRSFTGRLSRPLSPPPSKIDCFGSLRSLMLEPVLDLTILKPFMDFSTFFIALSRKFNRIP